MPKFHHRFTPARGSFLGNSVDLATRQIEDAGILEVLQTPGAALGTWAVFDALLVPGHEWFVFHSPLGQSREVKTALSGLFGRFVARAYTTHHLGFSHFQTIHSPPMQLTGAGGYVRRSRGHPSGDLPDWAAWGPSGQLAIIEAKGCNAASGLGTVLAKAYEQSKRATITVGRRNATFKRYAIAKAADWAYEREVRIVYNAPRQTSLPFLPDGLLSVIIGPRMSSEDEAKLRDILARSKVPHLPVRRASLSSNSFSVEID